MTLFFKSLVLLLLVALYTVPLHFNCRKHLPHVVFQLRQFPLQATGSCPLTQECCLCLFMGGHEAGFFRYLGGFLELTISQLFLNHPSTLGKVLKIPDQQLHFECPRFLLKSLVFLGLTSLSLQ